MYVNCLWDYVIFRIILRPSHNFVGIVQLRTFYEMNFRTKQKFVIILVTKCVTLR